MLRERQVKAGTTGGVNTRVYFFLVDGTDYVTPETGEAGQQPQISTNGAAWTATGIGTLTSIGNGSYYADLTTGTVDTAGRVILTRYFRSGVTAEARGTSVITTVYAPSSETQTVSLGTSTIGSAQFVDGAITAAKFGAGAITSTVLADNAITAPKIASDAITAAKIAADAITAAKLATGVLTADAVGANAFVAAAFATDLNAYSVVVRLSQSSGTAQKATAIIYANGAPLTHATFASDPTMTITTTAGVEKFSDALSEFGSYGYFASLSGASLLAAGDAAEATVTFVIGVSTYTRSVPIEKQYT